MISQEYIISDADILVFSSDYTEVPQTKGKAAVALLAPLKGF